MIEHKPRYTYACDDVQYKRKDNPDAWITVEEIGKEMFSSYPVFSFIPGTKGEEQPVRYGDFVIDIDTKELACKAARTIIDWFRVIYGVEPEQWRIYLSGKKGVHLELPATILGVVDGHVWLPLAYKILAMDLEAALSLELDTSMYNKGTGKPFRRPNVMRDTGTCKRQIDFDDLYEIEDEEDYREACKEPGEIWQPEDISRNNLLAEKISGHLADAEKQQEAIKLAPKLTGDELDRLINERPGCITVLAGLKEWTNGKTFNDIAIQLTAYAVTAGISENELLAGAKNFITYYPSSSLNTLEKRYENIRARYRTMAANGNAHSCGGILALKVPGFDCSTCNCKTAGPQVSIEVMTEEDAKEDNISLNIPESVLNPGGLISLGMKALSVPGNVDITQYNLPAVLATLGHAAAGKMTCMKKWPNLFIIRVGKTSTGKTTADQALYEVIDDHNIPNFYGATDFASGPALMRAVAAQPIQMIVIDEATGLFRRYKGGDGVADGKRDALLEIFSKSGGKIVRSYADSKNNIEITSPCVTITGNCTPVIFDTIHQEDFDTGTLQRFDFWCYDGPIPERGIESTEDNQDLFAFAEGIAAIRAANPGGDTNLAGLGGGLDPFKLQLTPECRKTIREWSSEVIQRANAAFSPGEQGIISRAFDLSIKYAIIHVVGTRPVEKIFYPMDVQDIHYGKEAANMLCNWKVDILRGRVSTGEFDQMCKTFMEAVKAAAKVKSQWPTYKYLANRRPVMRNWKPRESAEVIEILRKRGDIILDESRKNTGYFAPKCVL
jgi:hypothetical protein